MAFWTDKYGNKLTLKQFKERYKEGVDKITPKQMLQSNIFFQQIMMLGFFFGLCLAIYNYKTMWWLAIILLGGLGINVVQYLGLQKQMNIFKKIEEQFKNDLS